MRFQRINRSDPEKVFVVCKNAAATALAAGDVVIWAYNATDDGLAVAYPTTTKAALVAGVVASAIAVSGYGELQCYGHNADCKVSGSTDVAIGDKLSAKTGVVNAIKAAGTLVAGESGVIVAGQAYTTTAAAAKKVFIRCM